MQNKALIFDLDGTLLDTIHDLYLATNYALRAYGMPERTEAEVTRFVGNGVRRLMMLAVPNGEDNSRFEEVLHTFRTYYAVHCRDNTRPYPGIVPLLQQLHADGYPMAIVSNKPQEAVTELCHTHFPKLIDIAIGETPDVRRKPAPDMLFNALRRLSTDARHALYIGDSEVDITTAHAAQLPCISVLWGFRSREELTAHGATILVATPHDLLFVVRDTTV